MPDPPICGTRPRQLLLTLFGHNIPRHNIPRQVD